MESLMKHAYLYATFSEEPNQLGAIIVQDEVIVAGGFNRRVGSIIVSEIQVALITCQHSTQDAMLVCPLPPSEEEASLIILAGIAQVVYDKRMKDLAPYMEPMRDGLKLLEANDIEIIPWEGYLGCFKLKYDGKTYEP